MFYVNNNPLQVYVRPCSVRGLGRCRPPGRWRHHDVPGLPWVGSRTQATVVNDHCMLWMGSVGIYIVSLLCCHYVSQVWWDGLQSFLSAHHVQSRQQSPARPQRLLQSTECGWKAVQPEVWLRVEAPSVPLFYILQGFKCVHLVETL